MKKRIKIQVCPLFIMGVLLFGSFSCTKSSDSSQQNNITPLDRGTITDIEGNIYKTVKLGSQWWMAENLRTTKYNDSTSITPVPDTAAWKKLSTPGYCWYNNDSVTYIGTYGALYNWFAVNTGKLAPKGWHIPTDAEWTTLTTYLGGELIAGSEMKETGVKHWMSPNTGATNSTEFTALPGGFRGNDGSFVYLKYFAYYWSSLQYDTTYARYRYLCWEYGYANRYYFYKTAGFSIRCVKD